jgi:hypothetical protein
MKTIILPILIFTALVALVGCKPKQTTLSGQMFIVTQGAENVKLGDVEILLIEKSQVAEFLQKEQQAVESQIKIREQAVETAETNAQKAEYDFDIFMDNQLYATNADYIKFKDQLDEPLKLKDALAKQMASLEDGMTGSNYYTILNQEGLIRSQNETNDPVVDDLQIKLESTKNDAVSVWKSASDDAQIAFNVAKAQLANFPTIEDYLANFAPTVFQKTLTDADGKFSFTYPRDKSFTIFAIGERKVLSNTEKYYWFVDAPVQVDTAQIFLSNKNLVEVDPDNYFTMKPKQIPQESAAQ